jgi:type VI secretion system protein ImpA
LPEGFDLDALLAPLSEDAPAGVDPRSDFSPQSVYFRLRDARAEARAAERAADSTPGVDAGPIPQWRTVEELAIRTLTTDAKDLEIAAWLAEALVRRSGLEGLAVCARLMAGLVERYWEQSLFPLPDEDGISTRVAPVTGLNGEGGDGTLIQPLRKLTLFPMPDGTPLSFWQYEQSADLVTIADSKRRQRGLESGVLAFEEVEKLARAAGATYMVALRRDARAAIAAWQALGEALDARAGADSPPTSRVRELLEALLAVAAKYAPPEADVSDAPEAESEGAEAGGPGGDAAGMVLGTATTRVVTRDDMLRELVRIADYFRRTEPQSPLAYTLEEAVRRGRMSWPDLLAELVPERGSRDTILTSLGIRPPSGEAAE